MICSIIINAFPFNAKFLTIFIDKTKHEIGKKPHIGIAVSPLARLTLEIERGMCLDYL